MEDGEAAEVLSDTGPDDFGIIVRFTGVPTMLLHGEWASLRSSQETRACRRGEESILASAQG